MVPFRRAFPLELFTHIIAHADQQAISRTARASSACYELFMPVLLDAPGGLDEERTKILFQGSCEVSAHVRDFSRPNRRRNSNSRTW